MTTRMRRWLPALLLLMLSAPAVLAQNDYTTTANLALKKPKIGSTNFGVYINQDFDTLDAAIGPFHGGFKLVTFTPTPIFNLTQGNTFQLTLSGDATSSTVNQPSVTAGQFLYLIVCQDGVGSHTFAFPASFQSPLPSISGTPGRCSASTWVWSASFSAWINTGGGGGGGGGTPTPPNKALQYDQSGSFGATSLLYTPSNASCSISGSVTCDDYVLPSSNVCVSSTLAADASVTFGNAFSLCNLSANAISGGISGAGLTITSSSRAPAIRARALGLVATALGAAANATALDITVTDDPQDVAASQVLWGVRIRPSLTRAAGTIASLEGVRVDSPFNFNTGGAVAAETVTNLYGLHVLDQLGKGATRTAALQIDAQTGGGLGVAVDGGNSRFVGDVAVTSLSTLTANPSTAGVVRLASADAIGWRNNANGANVLLSKNTSDQLVWPNALSLGSGGLLLAGSSSGTATLISLAAGGGTHTLPNNTGTLAELNLAQTWSANQSVANGTELRFFSTNATNYAGFKGGASTVNLVYAMPTADATGTQCFATTAGSFVISFTACSAGTGTPGGANTYNQYNSAGTFGGSPAWTFNGTDTVGIGLLNTTLGKLQMFGNTSGSVTIQTQAVAGGTLTFTLPNASGTALVSASAPLAASATTGNLTCLTCTKNAAAATANQLLVGGGGQDIVALGTLGTTTTVLHGNASGLPTFAAVNLATETTGVTAIANGGTNGATATAGFDNLSPTTTRGDLIVRGASNNVRLPLGGNGTCVTSNGTDAVWGSCAAGAVSGTATSGQGTFWNGSATIGGSVNWLYSASSGHSLIQGANNVDLIYGKRFTDTTPTGNFLHFQNAAANTDLFKVDVNGAATLVSLTFSGAGAGGIQMNQGAAPALAANAINLAAPTSVAASGENFIFPGNPSTGFIRWANVAGTLTGSFAAASGIGNCGPNQLVQQNNDNASPTCASVVAAMFTSQAANSFLAAPSGSAGIPTFRVPVSADIPPIQLNSAANGGVTNILPIANGGTNASSASTAFNNLSPMTTAGDIIYGGASGAGTRLAAGTATQLLHSGATPSWSAVSLTADVTGVLPLANGGTNASSGLANTNGVVYSDGTKLVSTATGGAGTLCLTSTAGGTPVFGSCSGGASTSWSNLTAPGADLSLSMSTFNTLFTHGIMVGTRNIMEWTDGASTSTGSVLNVHTNASSTMKPFTFTALGTANGIQMDNTGAVAVIGTGHLTADKLSRTITATSPLTIGGGSSADLTADRTVACLTCVSSGAALASNAVVLGSGGGQGTATVAGITTDGTSKLTLGVAGASVGSIDFKNATSGTINLAPATGALGTSNLVLPIASATLTYTVASGTSALGTSAITSATCATVVTTSATGVATTDTITAGFNGDPTAVTGYIPATAGMLTIIGYPTANNVNWKVCNNTGSSITPGAITINWRVVR